MGEYWVHIQIFLFYNINSSWRCSSHIHTKASQNQLRVHFWNQYSLKCDNYIASKSGADYVFYLERLPAYVSSYFQIFLAISFKYQGAYDLVDFFVFVCNYV